jgi:hypothetical protein
LASHSSSSILLYEKRDYFEYTPAMLRVIRDPKHMKHSHISFSEMGLIKHPRIKVIHEEVVQITARAVLSKGGEWQPYDKLVLAMGSDYGGGKDKREAGESRRGGKSANRTMKSHTLLLPLSPCVPLFSLC